MQSVSGTLAAAITALVRRPLAKLTVPWTVSGYTGDISAYVTSLTIDRSITTDLPDATNIVSGGAAAQATAELGGAALTKAMSPFTVGTSRLGATVSVDLGMQGTAGAEYVPAFRGRVRSTSVSSGDRSGSLEALDGPETMRTAVTLPVFPAVDPASSGTTYKAPNLTAGWVLDYVARANGYYSWPAPRASVAVAASMRGSTWPEAGTLISSYKGPPAATIAGPCYFTTHVDGVEGLSGDPAQGSSQTSRGRYTPAVALSVNQTTNLFAEARITLNGPLAGATWLVVADNLTLASATAWVGVTVVPGQVSVQIKRAGATSALTSIATAALTSAADHYLGVHIAFTTAGANVNVRVDGTTYTGTVTVGNPTGNTAPTIVEVLSGVDVTAGTPTPMVVSGVQVTTEAFSSGMWNNTFTRTYVPERSLNQLVVMPAVEDRAPWNLVQEIVAAEQGVALFDESGVFRFYNRTHMTGGAAVATITAASNLKAVSASEAVDDVRNIVQVPAAPLTLDLAEDGIWTLNEMLVVPASGSIEVNADFGAAAYTIDTSVAYAGSTASGYRAAKNSDGTGGDISNLTITVTQYPARARIFITNPNAFDAWLVANSAPGSFTQGEPNLYLYGRLARPPENPYLASVSDATSITAYGEQSIQVEDNPWRQSSQVANDLAAALLARLKDPHPVLSGVEIVADPRLQLADRVRVVDTTGLALDADCWLLGITTRYDTGGLSQSVTLRQV